MSDHERLNAALDSRLRDEGAQVRAMRAGCPPPELLMARDAEALAAATRGQLDAHLAICDACRRLADDVARLDLGAAEPPVEARVLERVRAGGGHRRFGALLPVAAALVLGCALAVQGIFDRIAPEIAPAAGVVSTPSAPPPAPSSPDAALWAIAAPPLRLSLSSLDPTRGGEPGAHASALVGATTPYQAGDYPQAAERFAEMVQTTPSSGEAQFYLGVSRLLSGRPGDAIAPLTAARTLLPAARWREVDWYLATAQQRSGDPAGARTRLEPLCRVDGPYRTNACSAEALLR